MLKVITHLLLFTTLFDTSHMVSISPTFETKEKTSYPREQFLTIFYDTFAFMFHTFQLFHYQEICQNSTSTGYFLVTFSA